MRSRPERIGGPEDTSGCRKRPQGPEVGPIQHGPWTMVGVVAVGSEATYEERSQPVARVKVTRAVTLFLDPVRREPLGRDRSVVTGGTCPHIQGRVVAVHLQAPAYF